MDLTTSVRSVLRSWMPDPAYSAHVSRLAGRNPVEDMIRAGTITQAEVRDACGVDWLCAECVTPIADSTSAVCDRCWQDHQSVKRSEPSVLVSPSVKRQIKAMAHPSRKGSGDGKGKGGKKTRA